MQEQINVLTAEQYFKKYGDNGIGKGADRWMIKRQLIDAFRREVFQIITDRLKKTVDDLKDIPEGDPEAIRVAKNVIHDTTMKWKKLCKLFDSYVQTANLIKPEDLKLFDDIEEEKENDGSRTEDSGREEIKTEGAADVGTGGHPGSAEGYSAGNETEEEVTNESEV